MLFPEYATNPPSSSPSDLISSIPLVCYLPKGAVTAGVWPVNLEDSSQTVINKDMYFLGGGVVLRVSAPHSSTDLTLELNRRIFVCNDTLERWMFLSCINAPLILALISASVSLCLSMILHRYVRVSTLSISFPSSLTGSMLTAFTLRMFVLHLCYLSPLVKRWLPVHLSSPATVDGCGTTVPGHRQNPGLQVAYLVSTGFHFFSALHVFIIKSMTRRKRNGDHI